MRLGLGKADLVFTAIGGKVLNPTVFSETFAREVVASGVRPTKFHGLRHLHITHLLKSGVPVHVVSARAGHARPSITFDAYSNLLGNEDEHAAEQADDMLRRALGANSPINPLCFRDRLHDLQICEICRPH